VEAVRCGVAGLALSVMLATALPAQVVISGVVMDGLAGHPLAAATVQLVLERDPSGRIWTVTTDSAGAFRMDGIQAGRYLLGFTHYRVDELGIEIPPRAIEVAPGVPALRYELTVPGPRALARVLCRGRSDSSGVLAGRVLDADDGRALAQGSVTASWVELRIADATVRRIPHVLRANLDESGRFAICDVPSDVAVRVEATAGAKRSGEVELQVPAFAVLPRDLLVAPVVASSVSGAAPPRLRGNARVAGHVRRTDGRPVERAQVLLMGSGIAMLSDASGAYTLDSLPEGTRAIEVRALGFAPASVVLDLRSGVSTTVDLSLTARVAVLEAVTVYGKAPKRGEAGQFVERSHGMFGRFMTAEQIARSGAVAVPDLLRMIPGLRVTQASGSMMTTVLSRGETFDSSCMPDVYLDGMLVADGASSLDNLVRPNEIGGIEIYVDASTVPVQFRRGACGSIVIWTRIMLP
jgi:hypothetical protein